MLTFGSLFSGVGGFDLGFEQAGLKCLWQVEIDKNCNTVLDKHFPDVRRYTDVREVTGVEPVDIICGGFPCQDVSIAGKRDGLAGERSGLFFEFLRIIDELQPKWVVIENVPGLLSSNKGRDMRTILLSLGDRGYGYAYRVLDSQYFGVPQRRRRVFIVGSLGSGSAGKVLFESKSLPRATKQGRKKGETDATRAKTSLRNWGEVAPALTSRLHKGPFTDPVNDGLVTPSTFDLGRVADRVQINAEKSVTLQAEGGGLGAKTGLYLVENPHMFKIRGGIAGGGKGYLGQDEKTYTLSTGHDQFLASEMAVRRLTPLECERLQGFPDNWTEGLSDTGRYRAMGNAVTVPVARWIGERINEAGF